MPKALILDPDIDARTELGQICRSQGYVVSEAITLIDAVHQVSFRIPELIFAHLDAFDTEIEAFLSRTDVMEGATLFLICDQASIAMAKLGMRVGAAELFTKPLIKNQIRQAIQNLAPDIEVHSPQNLGSLVGASSELLDAFDTVKTAAEAGANLLLCGESGTGKEALAQESCLDDEKFIAVSCAGLAAGQSLPQPSTKTCYFFDELLELEIEGQLILEGLLQKQNSEQHIRVVGSSAGDLAEAANEGTLRPDLYYQLAQITVNLPPLRERPHDLHVLIQHLLQTLNKEHRASKFFTDPAIEVFTEHDWPGNARELENAIFHAFILGAHELDIEHLPQTMLKPNQLPSHSQTIELEIGRSLAEAERHYIQATMEEFNGDKKMVASILGISLRTLYNKLNQYKGRAADSAPLVKS